MSSFLGLFLLGTYWWWLTTIVFLIWFIVEIEKESYGLLLFTIILYGLYLQFIAKCDFIGYLLKNPLHLVYGLLSYVFLGVIWSFVEWWLLVNKKAEKQKVQWQKFLARHGLSSDTNILSQKLKREWDHDKDNKPLFDADKHKITFWISYWPLFLIWSLIHDFIKRVIDLIVKRLKKIYESITDKVYKKFDNIKVRDSKSEPETTEERTGYR